MESISTIRNPGKQPVLLLVDDSPAGLHILRQNLENEYEIHEAQDGFEALTIVRGASCTPDIIVSDQQMPRMTGIELFEVISKEYPQIIRFLISAHEPNKNLLLEAVNRGNIHSFIPKPINVDYLKTQLTREYERIQLLFERNQISVALNRERQKLKTLIDLAPVTITSISSDWNYLSMNQQLASLLGVEERDIIGKKVGFMTKDERFREFVDTIFSTDKERHTLEFSLGLPGRKADFLLVARRYNEGKEAIIIGLDVTELNETRQALAQSEAKLAQAHKLEAIGRLAGGLAHDYNNLLTIINGYSQYLYLDADDKTPLVEFKEILKDIYESGCTAAELTTQLLAFGRKQLLKKKVVSPSSILSDLKKMIKTVLGDPVEYVIEADAKGFIETDPGQFEQVILNLVVNAKDAMPDGGWLTIGSEDFFAEEGYLRSGELFEKGHYIHISVTDTGHGMSTEVMNRIFEPFFTTKSMGKGTGLGLSTVHGIVGQLGGRIIVQSEVGKGTTFHLYFPCTEKPPDETEKKETAKLQRQGKGRKILIVEDDSTVRRFLSFILGEYGFELTMTQDGDEALYLFSREEQAFDLVISDVVMPKCNGVELLRRLRLASPGLQCLLISGFSDTILDDFDLTAMNVELMRKPFGPHALVNKVFELLSGSPSKGIR